MKLFKNVFWKIIYPFQGGICSKYYVKVQGERDSVVGWDGRSLAGSIPVEVIRFFNWTNPFSRTMAPKSTQPLTEMSTRNLPGGKGRPVCKVDNFTAICEPIV
jgi:hypothetical protein